MRELATSIILALLFGELISSGKPRAGRPPKPVGDALVDIGGRRLHVTCTGAGSPRDHGGRLRGVVKDMEASNRRSPRSLASARMTVPARNERPRSEDQDSASHEPLGRRRSPPSPARRRHQRPYVLVGHSLGGAHIRLFASRFPQDTVASCSWTRARGSGRSLQRHWLYAASRT